MHNSQSDAFGDTNVKDKIDLSAKDVIISLRNLQADKTFNHRKDILQKLQNWVLNAVENEKQLHKKCQEFQKTNESNRSKVEAALLLRNENRAIIDKLKAQLSSAWENVELAYIREKKVRDEYCCLEKKFQEFQSIKYVKGEKEKLLKTCEEIKKENKDLKITLNQCEAKLVHIRSKYNSDSIEDLKKQFEKKSKMLESVKEKLTQETKKNNELEKEIMKIKSTMENLKNKTSEFKDCEVFSKLHKQLTVKTNALERTQKELAVERDKASELHDSFLHHEHLITRLADEKDKAIDDLMNVQFEERKWRKEFSVLKTLYDRLVDINEKEVNGNKLKNLEEKNLSLQEEYNKLLAKHRCQIMAFKELKIINNQLLHSQLPPIYRTKENIRLSSILEEEKLMIGKKKEKEKIKEKEERERKETELLKSNISQMTSDITKYQLLNKQLENTRDNYINEMQKQKNEICALKMQINSFESLNYAQKLENLQKKINDNEILYESTKDRFNKSENIFKEEIDSLTIKLAIKERENANLHDNIYQQEIKLNNALTKLEIYGKSSIEGRITDQEKEVHKQNIEKLSQQIQKLEEEKLKLLKYFDLSKSTQNLLSQKVHLQSTIINRIEEQHMKQEVELSNHELLDFKNNSQQIREQSNKTTKDSNKKIFPWRNEKLNDGTITKKNPFPEISDISSKMERKYENFKTNKNIENEMKSLMKNRIKAETLLPNDIDVKEVFQYKAQENKRNMPLNKVRRIKPEHNKSFVDNTTKEKRHYSKPTESYKLKTDHVILKDKSIFKRRHDLLNIK